MERGHFETPQVVFVLNDVWRTSAEVPSYWWRVTTQMWVALNSAANPFLTTFRIRELKKSVKIVLHLTQEGNEVSLNDFRQQHYLLRNSNFVSLWVAQTPSPDKFTLGYRLSCKSQRESRKAKRIIILLKHLSRAALHMNVNWIQNFKNWELDNQSNLRNFKLFNCN